MDEMRSLYASGDHTHPTLAKKFGVSPFTVGIVCRGVKKPRKYVVRNGRYVKV
jgi:hypothetical protein